MNSHDFLSKMLNATSSDYEFEQVRKIAMRARLLFECRCCETDFHDDDREEGVDTICGSCLNKHHGTVSHGTLRREDLIPTFMEKLDEMLEDSTFLPGADHPSRVGTYGSWQDRLGSIERNTKVDGYYDSEDADYDLETLFEGLNEYAPPGFYFGAHPGDGSDFGYWVSEDDA